MFLRENKVGNKVPYWFDYPVKDEDDDDGFCWRMIDLVLVWSMDYIYSGKTKREQETQKDVEDGMIDGHSIFLIILIISNEKKNFIYFILFLVDRIKEVLVGH